MALESRKLHGKLPQAHDAFHVRGDEPRGLEARRLLDVRLEEAAVAVRLDGKERPVREAPRRHGVAERLARRRGLGRARDRALV